MSRLLKGLCKPLVKLIKDNLITDKLFTKWKAQGEGMGVFERTHLSDKTSLP